MIISHKHKFIFIKPARRQFQNRMAGGGEGFFPRLKHLWKKGLN
jgi:hypothetical protein